MNTELYNALIEAGVSREKAEAAACATASPNELREARKWNLPEVWGMPFWNGIYWVAMCAAGIFVVLYFAYGLGRIHGGQEERERWKKGNISAPAPVRPGPDSGLTFVAPVSPPSQLVVGAE